MSPSYNLSRTSANTRDEGSTPIHHGYKKKIGNTVSLGAIEREQALAATPTCYFMIFLSDSTFWGRTEPDARWTVTWWQPGEQRK